MCTTKRLDLTVFLICFFCLIQFQLKKKWAAESRKMQWMLSVFFCHASSKQGKHCTRNTVLSTVFRIAHVFAVILRQCCHYWYCYDYIFFFASHFNSFQTFSCSLNARKLWDSDPRYIVAFVLWVLGVLEILSYSFHTVCECVFFSSRFLGVLALFFIIPFFSTHVQVLN